MRCCSCGAEAAALPTVRWRRGDGRRFVLCVRCLDAPLRAFVWIVPGEHTVNAKCQVCGSYASLSEMATLSPGAGKRDFGGVRLALSDDYLNELVRTTSKPRVEEHASVGRAMDIALVLAYMGRPYRPRKHDWPSIPDRKDWWILDLAFESGADHIVTWDTRHLAPARTLGFDVLDPPSFLALLPA